VRKCKTHPARSGYLSPYRYPFAVAFSATGATAAAFFAAHRAFAATANFILAAALIGFRAPLVARGETLTDLVATGAGAAAFFAAAFIARLFFAQRACWDDTYNLVRI
jgi:hypothetical protein